MSRRANRNAAAFHKKCLTANDSGHDRTKAWADTEASRVDLTATFRQMDDDQSVTPDAKAKLIWDVLSGYAWSQPLEAKFGVPNDLFAGTVPKYDSPASEDDAA